MDRKKYHLTIDDQNRVYLPQEMLDEFESSETDVVLYGLMNRLELETLSQVEKEEEIAYSDETFAELERLLKDMKFE